MSVAEPSEGEGRREDSRRARGSARVAVRGSGLRSRGAEDAPQVGSSESHPDVPSQSTQPG